jgi:hypothetical protein
MIGAVDEAIEKNKSAKPPAPAKVKKPVLQEARK